MSEANHKTFWAEAGSKVSLHPATLPLLLRGTNDRTESKLCVDNTRRTIESYINHEVNVRMLACSA